MINSLCPLPIGTKLSIDFNPVCIGSLTDLRGIIPGALTSTLLLLIPLSKEDNADALYYLGSLFYYGLGVVQNFNEAEKLKNKAFKKDTGPELIYASIPGPEMIEAALKAGINNKVSAKVGAQVDDRYAPPILLNGTVEAIHQGDIHAETEVVIRVGSIKVIVTKKRKPYHREKDFTQLNLNPRKADILVVKIGYLVPELYNIRGGWNMALTPGGVDQDLERLGYKRIKRPMFPLDKQMDNVDLKTRFIKASDAL